MKKFIIIILILLFIPSIYSQECQQENLIQDIPCGVTTPYRLENSCETYYVSIYNESGELQTNLTLKTRGETSLCNFTFNISQIGSYHYNTSFLETGTIKVTNDKMGYQTSLVFIIMSVFALFLYLGFKLNNEFHLAKWVMVLFTLVFAPPIFLIMGVIIANYSGDNSLARFFEILLAPYLIVSFGLFLYIIKQVIFSGRKEIRKTG